MDAILNALKEERKEAQKLLKKYRQEFNSLPEGTFFTRKIGKQTYSYITSSKNGEIKQRYLGNLEPKKIKKYKEVAHRKKKLKSLIKKAKKQLSFLDKALRHAGKKG